MKGIRLSEKYGVNPSVEVCHICGKEMGLVMYGTSYKDENGKTAEAPRQVCLGHACDDCKKVMDQGGIFFIETQDGESGNNPRRTGRVVALKEEAVKRIFQEGCYSKVNYMEHYLWEQLFPDVSEE